VNFNTSGPPCALMTIAFIKPPTYHSGFER
jgi:hypothetical protein